MSVKIIAHKGYSSIAPENTLPAVRRAIVLRLDIVEVDVQMSKEGIPVLMHDHSLERTTGLKANVNDLTLDEMKQLDAGSWFSDAFKGEKIPTLEELFKLKRGKTKLMLDIKIETFDAKNLLKYIPKDPSILIGALQREVLDPFVPLIPPERLIATIETKKDFAQFEGLDVHTYALDHTLITQKLIHDYHKKNKRVWAWTVDDSKRGKELVQLGIDGIITNNPLLISK